MISPQESRVKWKIFYDDFSTYSNLDGPPEDAKAWGVQVIALLDYKIGRTIQFKKDYYIWKNEQWWGVDHMGFIDYMQQPGFKKVLFGRVLETETFKEICDLAMFKDEDLPYKTVILPEEKV